MDENDPDGRNLVREIAKEAALIHAIRTFRETGELPYGYAAGEGSVPVEDEAEQAVLAEIRNLRGAGLSMRSIVHELELRGFVSPRAGKRKRVHGRKRRGRAIP